MPIFSLPSKYGMGSFGKEGYEFVDFLRMSGQKIWQVLPLVQTGFGNSPYSSVSSDSFNPYFISVEQLKNEGLLTENPKISAVDGGYYPQLVGNLIICGIADEDGNLTDLQDFHIAYIMRYIELLRTNKHPKGYYILTKCTP